MPVPFWSGKNAKIYFFIDGKKVPLDVRTWSVKANVTKAADGVGGEKRDRLQTIINYYEISLTCWQVDVNDLAALLVSIDNDDAMVEPLDKQVTFLIKPNRGKSAGFIAHGDVTFDDWEWASPGRTERQTLTIPIRAQYFDPVKTI